jgi:integrase
MEAAYWLPLPGLYTGARISELAQLHTDDVREDEEAGGVISWPALI